MPRVAKRPTEESAEPSPDKKARVSETLPKFEQMKKDAEAARQKVRDDYLRDLANAPPVDPSARRETIATIPAVRTPTSRRKSTSSDAKPKTPSKPKSPAAPSSTAEKKSVAKSKSATATGSTPKPRKTPTKTPSEKKISAATAKSPATKKTQSKKTAAPAPSSSVSVPVAATTAPVTLSHMSSVEDEDNTDIETDDDWSGQLYPSVAMSDAFNAIGHLCAAFMAVKKGQDMASIGFLAVWLAAIVGVLRFGVSEKLFAKANSDLANLAGIVGYPMIGMSYAAQHYKDLGLDLVVIGAMLVAWEAMTRSFLEKNRDNAKIATNIIFFVGPIAAVCRETGDYETLAALIAFVGAGVIITPHHENRIFGVRCVDWFHYIIGATACVFAKGLGKR